MKDSETTESQFSLFDTITDKAIYELPINERIRNLLRLEFLFHNVEHNKEKTSEWDSRQCIGSLIDICELLSRTDIRGELSKELDKQINRFKALQSNPQVEGDILKEFLTRLRDGYQQLSNINYQPGQVVRNDELLNSIKQRISIAGGTCSFDMPSFHYWLNKSTTERKFQINQWMDDLTYIQQAVELVLNILRTSTEPTREVAQDGFFQYSMSPEQASQLVRILLPIGEGYFPEISGGRHRFSVRFLEQPSTRERPSQLKRPIDFELQCCL